ncbi:FAD-dependent oxidoreductase [Adhaeribacter sp. BT258]|uniref:FAD-dependent oxidoreductase n=1 Tax=Adhaeribacter terrigena TaxID=2793070 RepID=A0ABS1BWD5_9BACT|nr:FAD-dependent oxidoreductase [Adhaeribacter terrigena]MBK0401354.1 FAD-dependent oxidoreductase [Adhaeribacter terrigena]
MLYDFLVVGHGLAGAILAQTLEKRGHNVLVFDFEKNNSASNVAAGLINPVAGKRFAKSWQADVFIPAAEEFYRNLETELGTTLYHQKPILKLFSSIEEQNNWMGKSAENQWNEYIEETYPSLPFSETVNQELGGLKIARGGFVELRKMLSFLRQKLGTQNKIRSGTFQFSNLKLTENGIQYEDIRARHLIFCEGWQAVNNPYFGWLPFSINKGEVLDISVQNFTTGCIYNKGVYVVPLGEERWKVGATYNWREPNELPTAEGREELLGKVKQLLKIPVEVTGHLAGIRPATRDRKPLIGTHPEVSQLSIFNGMGSKGVLMAPFLAGQFADALAGKSVLWPEVSIDRYRKFFNESEQKG